MLATPTFSANSSTEARDDKPVVLRTSCTQSLRSARLVRGG